MGVLVPNADTLSLYNKWATAQIDGSRCVKSVYQSQQVQVQFREDGYFKLVHYRCDAIAFLGGVSMLGRRVVCLESRYKTSV